MAITINGIICQEIVRDFSEEFDLENGPTATKGYYCDWADRYTVVIGLLGLSTTVSIGGVITLLEPSQYPQISTIYAHSIEIEPKGPPIQGTGPQFQFSNCIVWCHYKAQPWTFSGIDQMQIDPSNPLIYAKQNMSMSIQFYEIPGRMLYYKTGKVPTGQAWSFPCPIINLRITLIRMPYLPSQSVIAAATAGPLNSTTFLGCAPGTVMFNGFENDQTHDASGNFTQDGTYSFSYRPVAPWDYGYNGIASIWDQIQDSNGNPIMQRTPLQVLFPSAYQA